MALRASSGTGSSIGGTSRKRGTTTTTPTPPPTTTGMVGSMIPHTSTGNSGSGSCETEMEPLVMGHNDNNNINNNNNSSNTTTIPNVISSSSGNSPTMMSSSSSSSSSSNSKNRFHPRRYNNNYMTMISSYIQSQLRFNTNNSNIISIKLVVLIILSLQNSLFTVLRRYSQGIQHEQYSKYEVLMMGEIIKLIFSSYMIYKTIIIVDNNNNNNNNTLHPDDDHISTSTLITTTTTTTTTKNLQTRLVYLTHHSSKMIGLAIIYGIMNILSFIALRNIDAGTFTIFAQCKILTTATFSALLLQRHYSYTQWRALITLVLGVLLFSEPIWNKTTTTTTTTTQSTTTVESGVEQPMVIIGVLAVMIEVTLSGFASIYFEKVIKLDPLPLTIWERNYQLALGSIPVYIGFILWDGGGSVGYFGGWSLLAWMVTILGAAGGLLVALSIKYGDAILKTLATTAAIILSSLLDHYFLNGPLTPIMMIAALQVIIAICNYTFDTTPEPKSVHNNNNHNNNNNNNNDNSVMMKTQKDIEMATTTTMLTTDNAVVDK